MKPLILVKHSAPEIVKNIPAREWKLSALGQGHARELAGLLKRHAPEAIVSSAEPKARETAAILAEELGTDYRVVSNLHEHERARAPFYSHAEFQNLMNELFSAPDKLVFGEETARAALTRFDKAVELVLSAQEEKTIIIVSHGTVISLFVAQLTGLDGYALWQKLGLPSFVALDVQSKSLLDIVNLS
ncbi:MAG: histidine phosphatase family protein [Anaerolineales bacterium]|nr:histidine phosphatase family protein [Anaerolineales bacterium]